MEIALNPRYYFDLRKERKNARKAESAYTPAVSLIAGLAAALDFIAGQADGDLTAGRQALVNNAETCAAMTRAAVEALGLKLFAPFSPAAAVTAVLPPEGVDSGVFVRELKTRFGATITNGQGEMKGQLFRIAHLGFFDYMDTIALIGALEHVALEALKLPGVQLGDALIAAQRVYAERAGMLADRASCPLRPAARRLRPTCGRRGRAAGRRSDSMKILLAEKVSPATVAVLREEPGWEVLTYDQIASLPASLAEADALVVRSAVQVDDALMAHAPRLRVIGRAGVGVDNIDAEAATRRGIVVMNTPGANAIAVAELTLALMLALARELPRANTALHAGRWEKKSLSGSELRGKTLGILGLGRIGLEVAKRAQVFGMRLIGSDPFVAPAVAREHDVRLVSIDDLFRSSDYLSLHVGLTPQTHGIVNAQTLALMRPSARIINCARGELIHTPALAAALAAGTLAGAALDVFEDEPLKESPFFGNDKVLLTPHIAGSTTEAQEAVGIQIAEQVRAYLKLGVVQNAVNSPSLSHEQYLVLAPFADAAERLGLALAQLLPPESGGLESIHLSYAGALAQAQTEMVRNAAIAGVLGQSEGANRINAAQVAAERGVRVHEEAAHGGGSSVALTLHTRSGQQAGGQCRRSAHRARSAPAAVGRHSH